MALSSTTEELPDQYLARSHAQEGDIPGTVSLQALRGDSQVYGQAFFPVPAEDPNDPLQWSNLKKTMILVIVCLYSFLANSALLGPSVYIGLFSQEFKTTPAKASGLISYPNLAFGFGSLLLVPLYLKIGRRPVMLLSLLCFIGGLVGSARASTFTGLMVARVFHAFGSGVCEALPVQLVNDIFYLHERGKRIGYYTVCLCLGGTAPLYAGYMLSGGYSWRLFFYVETSFAAALFALAFIFVEETTYHRRVPSSLKRSIKSAVAGEEESYSLASPAIMKGQYFTEAVQRYIVDSESPVQTHESKTVVPPRKAFKETLKPWSKINHEAEFFMTMARSFTLFFVPAVFWVITTYGLYIGLAALAFNYTFPLKIVASPYNWKQENSGLIAVGNAAGYFLAIPLTFMSDRLAAYLTRRNNGIREAEMRLGVLYPAMIIGPVGLAIYGITAQHNLHWFGYFAGVAMLNWAAYFYFSFTLAYAIDSYTANTSEMLIAMNIGKQAISFGIGLHLLEWVLKSGYVVVISGIFVGVLAANNMALIIFVVWGKRIRELTARTWLGGWHKRNSGEVLAH